MVQIGGIWPIHLPKLLFAEPTTSRSQLFKLDGKWRAYFCSRRVWWSRSRLRISHPGGVYGQNTLYEKSQNTLTSETRKIQHHVPFKWTTAGDNSGPVAIETEYIFPLPDGAAVVEFAATFAGGRKITGVIKESLALKLQQKMWGSALRIWCFCLSNTCFVHKICPLMFGDMDTT